MVQTRLWGTQHQQGRSANIMSATDRHRELLRARFRGIQAGCSTGHPDANMSQDQITARMKLQRPLTSENPRCSSRCTAFGVSMEACSQSPSPHLLKRLAALRHVAHSEPVHDMFLAIIVNVHAGSLDNQEALPAFLYFESAGLNSKQGLHVLLCSPKDSS